MAYSGNRGIRRLIKATGYSWSGLSAAFTHEEAFRQELAMAAVLIPLALWLGDTGSEKALLIMSLFIVLITELVNSAIEAVVDRFGPERHKLAGRAKDIGSAAVFLSLVNLCGCWLLVLL
ncbi:MAG: diacylglycerol kinase [Gammaproteobacteria bacterium]|nr:diacylglycerol kinase [Gammaproteobacteria bacterium]